MANIVYFPGNKGERRYTISEWRKNVGDKIVGGTVLLSYKTDDGLLLKCSSNATGTVLKIFYPAGSSAPEGIPVCIVGQPNENITELVKYAESVIEKKDKNNQMQNLVNNLNEQIKNRSNNATMGTVNTEYKMSNGSSSDSGTDVVTDVRGRLTEINKDIAQYKQLDVPVSDKDPLVITFAGRFKTGKSSLINAIIGADILPTRATTATAVVTRIFKGKKAQAYLSENGKNTPITIEQAQDIILNYQVKDVSHPAEIIFELPIPWLGNDVEIRDTPGMDDSSQDGALEEIAMNSLRDTDLCICVYDAGAFPSGKERERTKKICETLNGNVVYAINCINHVNSLEGLNLVEKSAQALFGKMNYALPEMGKYWCICSAPGNLYLDEFDVWLKDFINGKSSAPKSKVRSISAKSQLRAKCGEYIDEINGLSATVAESKNVINKLHTESIRDQQDKIRRTSKERIDKLKGIKYTIEQELVDISSLENKLSSVNGNAEQMNKYDNDYSKMCCAVTANYFQDKYIALSNKYPNFLSKSDSMNIWRSVNNLQFPGKHTISVAATGGERAGWAAAGAIIGTLFGPGIGTAIGAAIGGAIGGADNTKDDSVSNTMSFIRSTVVPAVRGAFETIVQNAVRAYNEEAVEKCKKCKSGHEDRLSDLDKVLSECNDTQENLKLLSKN